MSGTGRWLILAAAGLGLATVVLSALGAHAIRLPDDHALRVWNTAIAMLGFHALALLGIAALGRDRSVRLLNAAGAFMVTGTALFSGTLLLRAAGFDGLPAVVPPVGGMMLMAGWMCLGLTGIRKFLP